MDKVSRGIASAEFLNLWLRMNVWWREVDELYLRNMDEKRKLVREHNEVVEGLAKVLKGVRKLIGHDDLLVSPSDSILAQTRERIRLHLRETHPEKLLDMPWSEMSLTKRFVHDASSQSRKHRQPLDLPQLLRKQFHTKRKDFLRHQENLCQRIGIIRDLQIVSHQLDQIARIVPQEYFEELFDIDISLDSAHSKIQRDQTSTTHHNTTLSEQLISEIFQYISNSRERQCLDALAYNKKLHDSIERFRAETIMVSARTDAENLNAQHDYTLLVKHYCEMHKQKTLDPKQIEWYSECQLVAHQIESHYSGSTGGWRASASNASRSIPTREAFVETARKLSNNISKFDQFRVNPLAKYLKRHYAIRLTLAFIGKSFDFSEMETYALLYTHFRRTHRLSFDSFLWYMKSFRSAFKRGHMNQLQQREIISQKESTGGAEGTDTQSDSLRFEKPTLGASHPTISVPSIAVPRAFY
eukprot:CAMPEP_0117445786 /NCGR_PEP_ID=MMETSP0759-20121206/5983_1 /TAXON_ID=63605 /ORGANISM="Percolomonas cosmopolitus, Strain WS" /LENGTH=469 /DNA_ID=CAMNT_0005237989 /DNA_START=493 /DNA_END=1902 /DNA_ORIENTATION=-